MVSPIPLEVCSIVPWPLDDDVVKMACVGRLHLQHKGQDVLFEALHGDRWKDLNWRLRLYGDGAARGYLEELARFYGLQDRVEFAGHVPDIRAVWADNHLMALALLGKKPPPWL